MATDSELATMTVDVPPEEPRKAFGGVLGWMRMSGAAKEAARAAHDAANKPVVHDRTKDIKAPDPEPLRVQVVAAEEAPATRVAATTSQPRSRGR